MKKILLIDDDKAIHELVKVAVVPRGYQLVSAFDSVQGLSSVRKQKPDLLILDINLPGGGGFQLYERMNSIPELASTKVLIFSALSQNKVSLQLHGKAPVHVLEKPATPDMIWAKAQPLLENRHEKKA